MQDVFETDDGTFHQAVLSLNKLILVRLVVERLALKSNSLVEWEWTVWPVHSLWDGSGAPVSGRKPSLSAAKRQAFDVGTAMLADLTRDQATVLPGQLAMRPPVQIERSGHASR